MLSNWKRGFVPSAETSAAIRMIRPLLVLFITFAHIGLLNAYGLMEITAPLDFDGWLTVFLQAGLAKSGVPLLSLISGYLAVVTLERYGYFKVLLRKARRLLWPMFWSNLLFIILITYPEQARDPGVRPDLEIYPFNVMGWFQATFAYYKLPANQPLFFLKDLFTCFLLLPLLIAVSRIRYLNVLVIGWMAWKCIYLNSAFLFDVYPLIFMRFDIVFAFYIGILLNYWRKDLVITHPRLNQALVLLFLAVSSLAASLYLVLAKPEHLALFLWADFIVKVCGVLGCIAIMSLLATFPGWLSRLLDWLSPFAYTLFLTHVFTFTFFLQLYLKVLSPPEIFGFSGILYLLMTVSTAILVSIALKTLWSALSARVSSRV